MTQEQWARALLARLGYPTSSANVKAVLAWMRAEGGHWNNSAHYNPLNTTQGMPGAHSMNSVGVKAYTSWGQGLDATVKTLRNGYYGSILSALKSGTSAQSVANAVVSSPWGTKHISLSGVTVSGGGGGYAGTVTPKLDMKTLAAEFGMTAAMVNSDKSLKDLFKKAVAGDWGSSQQGMLRFNAELKQTSWWRKQPSSLRKYLTQKYTDPATWKQKNSASLASLKVMAAQVGLDISKISDKIWDKAVYNDLAMGWSDERLKNWLGTMVKMTKGGFMLGEAGEAFDKLHELAYLNGVKYSAKWYADQSKKIVSGTSTIENQEQKIRAQAASTYSAFADQIKAGQNVMDLAAPYIKSVSQLLELPESDVDLFEPLVHNAMAGSHAGANFPLWQFENAVRNDPRWRKTNNAREGIFAVAHQVAKDFGMAY